MAETPSVRFNITVPVQLHRQFNTACAHNGESQTEALISFMNQYIAQQAVVADKPLAEK
jgi:hypothetical protein